MRAPTPLCLAVVLLAASCTSSRSHPDVQRAEGTDERAELSEDAASGPALAVEVLFIEASAAAAAEFLPAGAAWALAPSDLGPNELRLRAAARADIEISSRPRIVVRAGSRAEMDQTNDVEYVKDYTVDTRAVPQKVLDHVTEGLWIHVMPTLDRDQRTAKVELDITSKSVRQPIAEQVVHVGGLGANVRIQKPELDVAEASVQVDVALGRSFFVRIQDRGDSGRREPVRFALVRVDLPH
jgi:hypothetical protein